ncbi:MAG TPA: histidine phosphatase family protein [Stellaceae bacterium]|nr:histidine phosphatase family protein [Stellaceae bacterium]
MSTATRWWWVRHAPVTVNDGRCYGQTDLACDCSNAAAFSALARMLPKDAVWITSTLKRTYLTAEAIVRAGLPGPDPIPGPGVLAEPELAEQNFGAWQGVKYTDLPYKQGDSFHPFWLAPAHVAPPGGESFVHLVARVTPAVRRLTREHAGRDIIAVTHGGTIRAALSEALDLSPEASLAINIDNLSLTRLDHWPESRGGHPWQVVAVNQPPR